MMTLRATGLSISTMHLTLHIASVKTPFKSQGVSTTPYVGPYGRTYGGQTSIANKIQPISDEAISEE
jgi:hypothetical protein